jgi:microcystin-dependent protein
MIPCLVRVSCALSKLFGVRTPLLLLEARAELTHTVTASTTVATSTAAVATTSVAAAAATRVSVGAAAVAATDVELVKVHIEEVRQQRELHAVAAST